MSGYHMRRQDKAITDKRQIETIIRSQKLVTLAMCKDGEPYLVTMDYGYRPGSGCLYFHCAKEGKKLDLLRANPIVWGQIVEDLGYIEGECDHAFNSVQFKGRVELLDVQAEKIQGLRIMFDSLEGEMGESERTAQIEKSIAKVVVGRVVMEEMTGKMNVPLKT